jgi:eukaryotic-like serine/threonine-protein kinase
VLAQRWTLSKTLGVGGTGTVYEGLHRNGRRVAVKVLHPELAHHPTIRQRFASEGYAANRVRHPDAVAVLDDGEEADGTAFLVMELLEGRSLAKVLCERGALPVGEVVAAALSTLAVLASAHDNGVVHRDVKPANIFATVDGRFKLLDFGVARVADLASSIVTQTGGTVGTPAFMAPEQAAGRLQEIDALTDIWAVGATMFQLLTERLVHEASSHNGAIVAAATVPAPPIRSLLPNVPPELAQIIDRALAFERSARWPNARAMHLALRGACPELARAPLVEPIDQETVPEPGPVRLTVRHDGRRLLRRLGPLVALPLVFAAGLAGVLQKPVGRKELSSRARDSAFAAASDLPTLAARDQVVASAVSSANEVGAANEVGVPNVSPVTNRKLAPAVSSLSRSSRHGPKPLFDPPLTDEALLDRRK